METDESHVNKEYFVALRNVAARSIPEACAKFGVDIKFAEMAASLSMPEIERMSLTDLVVFKPVIDSSNLLKLREIDDPKQRHIYTRLSMAVSQN